MARHIQDCPPHELCGSPRYMAPEVMKGEGYTLKVDVYSFGILLFELCSLEVPFARQYGSHTKHKNKNAPKRQSSASAAASWWNRRVGTNGKQDTTNTKIHNVEDFYRRVIDTDLRPSEGLHFAAVLPCVKLRTLIEECWHTDPFKRPSFQEIVPRLEQIFAQTHTLSCL